jgi:hypothetical protein
MGSARLPRPISIVDPDGFGRVVVTVRSAAIHRHVVARVEHSGAHNLGGRHIARMHAAAHRRPQTSPSRRNAALRHRFLSEIRAA